MRFFSNNQYQGYNIYSFKNGMNKKIISKKIIYIIVLIAIIIMTLGMTIYYIVNTTIRIKKSKQFAAQIKEYKELLQLQIEIKEKEEKEKTKIPNLTEVGKEKLKNLYNSEIKKAFLTFDDGPSMNTIDILDILRENNIKATFFVLGIQVQYFPETTNKLYNEGHYIANHGFTHRYDEIYQSPEAVLNEFNQCNEIVANTLHIPEYNSHLFRFPGGFKRWEICSYKN